MAATAEMHSECLLARQSPGRQNCGADILSARRPRDTSISSNTSCANFNHRKASFTGVVPSYDRGEDQFYTPGSQLPTPGLRADYVQNANWDTTAVVGFNGTTGAWGVTQRYVYSPYGSITVLNADWSTPPSGTQPVVNNLYQGLTLDSVTGLYYSRFRNYNPSLGMWISQDPLSYVNGANTYQFVESGPVGMVDAAGLWKITRKGGQWATAVAQKNCDPVSGLAKLAKMDPSDAKKWMVPYELTSSVKKGDKVRIPNIVYLMRGDIGIAWPPFAAGVPNPAIAINSRLIISRIASNLKAKGFDVVTDWFVTAGRMHGYARDPAAFGLVFIGHGDLGVGWLFATDKEVSALTPYHKLGLVVLMACYSGLDANWLRLVSANGVLRAPTGEFTLSPWKGIGSVPLVKH